MIKIAKLAIKLTSLYIKFIWMNFSRNLVYDNTIDVNIFRRIINYFRSATSSTIGLSTLPNDANITALQEKFHALNNYDSDYLKKSTKPLCVYIVGTKDDHNGAIARKDMTIYYHTSKIQNLRDSGYDVLAYAVKTHAEINAKLNECKTLYNKQVKLLHMTCHGSQNSSTLGWELTCNYNQSDQLLHNLTEDCQIIFEACKVGKESNNIISDIYKSNKENYPKMSIFGAEYCTNGSLPEIKNNEVQKVYHLNGLFWHKMKKLDSSSNNNLTNKTSLKF